MAGGKRDKLKRICEKSMPPKKRKVIPNSGEEGGGGGDRKSHGLLV